MSKFRLIYEPSSLRHLSEVRISKSVWTHSQVRKTLKQKLQELPRKAPVDGYCSIDHLLELRDEDSKILTQVSNNIDKLTLPTDVKGKLKPLAEAMGVTIWEWLERMNAMGNNLLGNLVDYVDHIKWTNDGSIDSIEVLRSMYFSKLFPDSNDTWMKLSSYCLEDCLSDFFERVKSLNYDTFQGQPTKKLLKDSQKLEYIFPFYWAKFFQNRLEEDFTPNLEPLLLTWTVYCNRSEDLNVVMFWVAIENHNFPATKHFWESLNEEQRIRMFGKLSQGEHYYHDILRYCNTTRGLDLVIYLWKQFSAYDCDRFFVEMLSFVAVMRRIVRWPWEDLFMRTLEDAWSRVSFNDLEIMLNKIAKTIASNSDRSDHNLLKYRRIFNDIWCRIDDDFKRTMDLQSCIHTLFMDNECLDKIINDPALVDKRWDHINHVVNKYLPNEMLEFEIQRFCDKVLKNDEEKIWFKNEYDENNYAGFEDDDEYFGEPIDSDGLLYDTEPSDDD